jgi:hypothetical protein
MVTSKGVARPKDRRLTGWKEVAEDETYRCPVQTLLLK